MLAFDARDKTDEPGLHALIIGVSAYDHLPGGPQPKEETFGLKQLSGAARTAASLASFLVKNERNLSPRLRTCRVLLSPDPGERIDIGDTIAFESARLADVQKHLVEWRKDAKDREADATLFFFSGHGMQQTVASSFLLLQDWLAGTQPLDHALDFLNVYNGMRNGGKSPDMARTQIYCIDACRNSLDVLQEFENLNGAAPFEVPRKGSDDRVAPIFFGAAAGRNAFIINQGEPSLFGGQFIKCISGAAADKVIVEGGQRKWVVTIGSLADGLNTLIRRFNAGRGARVQTFDFDKNTDLSRALHVLDEAPEIEFILTIDPDSANVHGLSVELGAARGVAPIKFACPLDPLPFVQQIRAGGYIIRVETKLPGPNGSLNSSDEEPMTIRGPAFEHQVLVRP